MLKPPEIASELDEMKMNQRDKDVILSNNRIKSGLILNLSCVSGSVLDSMLLMDRLEKPFFSKLLVVSTKVGEVSGHRRC